MTEFQFSYSLILTMIASFFFFVYATLAAADIHDNIFLSHLFSTNKTEEVADRLERPLCEQGGSYTLPHKRYCDRFYTCSQGKPYLEECLDGLGYVHGIGCKPLHLVDCADRSYLQTPKGRGNCRRLFGIYDHPKGCGRYFRCQNGIAHVGVCPQKYMFDDRRKQCRNPSHEESVRCSAINHQHQAERPANDLNSFMTEFSCPVTTDEVLTFGQHTRHPYPGSCRYFIICLKDGTAKLSGCEAGRAFNPVTGVCEPERFVPNCKSKVL